MLKITSHIVINESEIELTFIRSRGPGGQNVNKVATAVQLRFNVIKSSSLPDEVRERLLKRSSITGQGDIIIKASRYRTQVQNREDARKRLANFIKSAAVRPKKRKKTQPTKGSVAKRLEKKKLHGRAKWLRQRVEE